MLLFCYNKKKDIHIENSCILIIETSYLLSPWVLLLIRNGISLKIENSGLSESGLKKVWPSSIYEALVRVLVSTLEASAKIPLIPSLQHCYMTINQTHNSDNHEFMCLCPFPFFQNDLVKMSWFKSLFLWELLCLRKSK